MLTRLRQSNAFRSRGFTLIEALALLFIFAVITTTFYTVFAAGTARIIESKNRLSAIAVANEKMEIIRNLDYDALGTKTLNNDGSYSYGIPAGDILEDEAVAVNTKTFFVHTFAQYVDDALDGKASGTMPVDSVPNDYKRIKVEVSWGEREAGQVVSLVSIIVPKGMEVSGGGGTLSINVIDNSGSGVSQATVHITNNVINPHIDITTTTDTTGNLILPGASAASQSYRIEASKNGYSGVTTYDTYPATPFYPVDLHASVVADDFNQKTIVMDKASDISVTTQDVFGADLPGIGFHIQGGRKIGDTDTLPSEVVTSLDLDTDSGSDGHMVIAAQSAGLYTIVPIDATRYRWLRLSENQSDQNTFSVTDGVTENTVVTVIDTEVPAILFEVVENVDGVATPVPLVDASVHLVNAGIGYDVTVVTDRYGQAYFPATSPPLSAGAYEYTVSRSGYADQTGTVVVTGALKVENVILSVS